MMKKQYFHICADGDDARHFIIGPKDFLAAMNIVALCAANTNVIVVAFASGTMRVICAMSLSIRFSSRQKTGSELCRTTISGAQVPYISERPVIPLSGCLTRKGMSASRYVSGICPFSADGKWFIPVR